MAKATSGRIAAIADVTDATKEALLALREAQAGTLDHVFPTMTTGRNPDFKADMPMSSQTIVRLLKLSSERAGIGHLSAHDLRRTHITAALDKGASLQDMPSASRPCQPLDNLAVRPACRCQNPARADRFLRERGIRVRSGTARSRSMLSSVVV